MFKKIITILLCIIILIGAGVFLFRDELKKMLVKSSMESVVTETTGIDNATYQEVINQLPEEDQETVVEIIANHVNVDTISQAQEILTNGSVTEAKDFILSELSETEILELIQVAMNNQSILEEYGITLEQLYEMLNQ